VVDVTALSTLALDAAIEGRGLCVGHDGDDWHPDETSSSDPRRVAADERRARRQCRDHLGRDCPVLAECLELALRIPAGRVGIWGGTTARHRNALLADRARQSRARAS
jgi:hypothetical protein